MKTVVTIQCKECNYKIVIIEGFVPKGKCHWCKNKFGWYFYPECLKPDEFELKHGDLVILNTRISPESRDRIHQIIRNKKTIYKKGVPYEQTASH